MTTPRTRLDEATNDFERDLLRTWEHEQPSRRARERAIGAITGGAVLATTASAGAAGVGVKLGVTAAILLLVAGGVVATQYTHAPAPTPAPPPPSAVVVVAPAPPPPPESVAPPAPAPPPVVAVPIPVEEPIHKPTVTRPPPPVVVASAAEPEPAPPAPPPPPSPKTSTRALGEQVALIDRARAALDSGDAAGALAIVDDYDSRFPAGSLSQEATLLRVEALLRQGRRQEAMDLGNRSLAAQPKSPYAAKIRRLLDAASANP